MSWCHGWQRATHVQDGRADICSCIFRTPHVRALLSGITQLSNRSVIQEVDYCIRRRDLNCCSLSESLFRRDANVEPTWRYSRRLSGRLQQSRSLRSIKKTVVINVNRNSWRETWIGITCLRPSFAGMRTWSLHGGIYGVSQTGDPDPCRLVKHRSYKNSINERLLYFKSQFEFVFINSSMKGCFSS
jgi:hypothetical protein